ncbi:carboxypeptidase-like regulatory domain-containing protein [bacterium]|nr:carboxypeptidase-like regulatory domain-containing protein [bacterium]
MWRSAKQIRTGQRRLITNLFILVIMMAFLSIPVLGQTNLYTITGHVHTSENKEPLHLVNIFLANTSLGTTTHKDGKFALERIPPGRYILIVSMIGYELHKEDIVVSPDEKLNYNFTLKVKALIGQSVTVTADRLKDWKKNLEYFKKMFLGKSDRAKECEISNPTVLDFKITANGDFIASAKQPIEVSNHMLGYNSTFFLKKFRRSTNSRISYEGYTQYTAMTPTSSEEEENWVREREKAYRGSKIHFFRSVAAKRAKAEGFSATKYSRKPGVGIIANSAFIDPDTLASSSDLYYVAFINLPPFMQVIYHKANTPAWYEEGINQNYQTSYIQAHIDQILINRNGNPLTIAATTSWGFWAHLAVADMLPLDYLPKGWDKGKEIAQWKEINKEKNLELKPDLEICLATRQALNDSVYAATQHLYKGLNNLTDHKFADSLLITMRDILTEKELKAYSQTTDKGKLILSFWQRRDFTPATPENERFAEHIQRLQYAKKYYRSLNKRGYDDRGMIYIKYGQPLDRVFMTADRDVKDNESWSYRFNGVSSYFDFADNIAGHELVSSPDKMAFGLGLSISGLYSIIKNRLDFNPHYSAIMSIIERQIEAQADDINGIINVEHPAFRAVLNTMTEAESDRGQWDKAHSQLIHSRPMTGEITCARFLREGQTVLEVYYALPYAQLTDTATAITESTPLRLSVKLSDGASKVYGQIDRVGYPNLHPDRKGTGEDYTGQFNIILPHTPSHCDISMTSLATAATFQDSLNLQSFDPDQDILFTSDIQIAENVEPAPSNVDNELRHLLKHGLIVRPYSRLKMPQHKIFYIYLEAYNLNLNSFGQSHYRVSYTVKSHVNFLARLNPFSSHSTSFSSAFEQYGNDRTDPIYFAIDFSQFKTGALTLKIEILDLVNNTKTTVQRKLELYKIDN